ncbi:MAG: class I SAM-dependent methyltransferase [Hyphomicrobium sp.]
MSADPGVRRVTPLAHKLAERIRVHGPISVSEYMSACLWDEATGYYATRQAIGASGDFITAAEISQIFGEMLGLWTGVVWQQVLGGPQSITLVEYGPGRGTMMRDVLRAARVVPGFAQAVRVHLVEASQVLQSAQRDTLSQAGVPITWGHNLIGFPAPAIILANEFLDAWPVDQWVKTSDGWRQRGVGLDAGGKLTFCVRNMSETTGTLDRLYPQAAVGAVVESQRPERFAEALGALARSGPFAALIIDYGYATASAGDTLQAVREHKYEDPLASPGEADISAHVSFFELASVLHAGGLAIDGPITQAEFLGNLGIIERTSRLMHANPNRAGEIETGVARLLAPNGMGTRFKVIGVRAQGVPSLPGFAHAEA